jgi:hypothetical protein
LQKGDTIHMDSMVTMVAWFTIAIMVYTATVCFVNHCFLGQVVTVVTTVALIKLVTNVMVTAVSFVKMVIFVNSGCFRGLPWLPCLYWFGSVLRNLSTLAAH